MEIIRIFYIIYLIFGGFQGHHLTVNPVAHQSQETDNLGKPVLTKTELEPHKAVNESIADQTNDSHCSTSAHVCA